MCRISFSNNFCLLIILSITLTASPLNKEGFSRCSLRVSPEYNPSLKKGSVDIIIEQKQAIVFTFTIDLEIKDKAGTRTEKAIIGDKITRFTIKGEAGSEIVPDPDIKLLYRIINN